MLLTPRFLLVILFVMISSSQGFDGAREKEYLGNVDTFRGFENLPRPSKVASACICGLRSAKCCGRKKMLSKVSFLIVFKILYLQYNPFILRLLMTRYMV